MKFLDSYDKFLRNILDDCLDSLSFGKFGVGRVIMNCSDQLWVFFTGLLWVVLVDLNWMWLVVSSLD